MEINIRNTYECTYKKQQKDTINFLACVRHNNNVLKVVKYTLKSYPTMLISQLYKYFYKWFEAEYAFNEDSDIFQEKMWKCFNIMMTRILTLELLYTQFPKEDKSNEILKLFILHCNKILGSRRNEVKNLPLLNPAITYNHVYKDFHYYILDDTFPYKDDNSFKELVDEYIKEITEWNEKCEYFF